MRSAIHCDPDEGHCDPDEEEFRTIIGKAAAKVRKGLKSPTRASALPKLSDLNALCDNVRDYEEHLWAQDSIPGIASKKLQWSSRFLACCFRLFRINQEAESRTNNASNLEEKIEEIYRKDSTDSFDSRMRKHWQTFVEIANSLVNGLLKAGVGRPTGCRFSACSRLSQKKRQKVVSGLVKTLRNKEPTVSCQRPPFDPAFLISDTLKLDYETVLC
ncbi:hypothetical protein DID88_005381 [Monilinia fructigena]|uniref:Uncharacterized protein n=1 Tax=Monilinia fructigena TaxID=38457 RepID=A0A395J1Z5_9HELO|nr:hypothetical protein DID88_005381 [Monilinia fructigena]